MKKQIIIGVVTTTIIIVVACLLILRPTSPPPDPDQIHAPSASTGNLAEKIVGNPETAKVIIYEYADFGCSHCADWNKTVNALIDQYGDDIALVFRNYNLNLVENSPAAARAATAANIQGYFKEYKDLLFAGQAEWLYADGEELDQIFADYFKTASQNSGNLAKFQADAKNDAVKTHLKFEQALGKQINLAGTPTFRIDGATVAPSNLQPTVTQKLKPDPK